MLINMKVIFKTKISSEEVLLSIFTKEYLEKNRDFFIVNAPTFEANYGEKIIVGSEKCVKIFAGIGKNVNDAIFEKFGWKLLKYIGEHRFKKVTLLFNNIGGGYSASADGTGEELFSVLRGMELANYSFDKYMSEKNTEKSKKYLEELSLIAKNVKQMEKNYRDFSLVRDNVFFCRDLINEPSNLMNPDSYSRLCKDLEKYGLEVELFGERDMEKLGMNLLLSVGRGSTFESKLVALKWKGSDKPDFSVAFVGKGVTFDSGGICIKPAASMYDMKCDMSGSAVVVATMKLLAERKTKINAVGIIGLVENMPSGNATKPGDIIKSMSGQTVEILNTDAEGRLVLADLLYYTITKYNPKTIIDFATLTGSIGMALGHSRAGVFTGNDSLAKEIEIASNSTGEHTWRMPLDEVGGEEYDKMMDSTVADVKNTSESGYAGSITAAQFLQRFTNGHSRWAHIDIAYTAFANKHKMFFVKNGATGYGVRLADHLVRNSYESTGNY
jgi:leucyl aminopeptidase